MPDENIDVARPHSRVQQILTDIEQLELEVIEDREFRGETVYLDGREFRNCSFDNCKIFIKLGSFRLTGALIMKNSKFHLSPPAEGVKDFVDIIYTEQGFSPPSQS